MFSVFFDVLSALQSYEKGIFQGVEVDFKRSGCYYDSHYGENWWQYYFEPICVGNKRDAELRIVAGDVPYIDPAVVEFHHSKEYNHQTIQKYIRIKPHIQALVDEFKQAHFTEFTIGVHFRGCFDKLTEAGPVEYSTVADEIRKHPEGTIFVATDEQPFIDFLKLEFPGRICCLSAIRSWSKRGNSPHLEAWRYQNSYKLGEDALVDCLLLSKTNLLIRTSSNLSLCSTFFNPQLKVIELNSRN